MWLLIEEMKIGALCAYYSMITERDAGWIIKMLQINF